MPSFTHTTFGSAKTQLAELLGDASKIFWSDSELGVYITEALRTWGASSLYWRDRVILSTVAGTDFYDITSATSPTILAPVITDQTVTTAVEYNLMEPPTSSMWTGTEQFTLEEIQFALQRRLNQFLLETGLITSYSTVNCPSPGNGRIPMLDSVIDVRRVAWKAAGGTARPLYVGDEFQFNFLSPRWSYTGGTPTAFSTLVDPILTVQLAPIPLVPSQLKLTTVSTGASLDLATGINLGIPDDLAWVIKWGTLAELLSSGGISKDNADAVYCEKRWQEGIEIAKLYPSILNAQIGGVPIALCSVSDLDTMIPSWQGSSGTPTNIAMSSYNLVALYPVPSSVVELELDIVRPAPIPASDSDFIQIGKEYISTILDYSQHLAAFKERGLDFEVTQSSLDNFMRAAAAYNSRLRASSLLFPAIASQTTKEERERPRFQNAQ